jgi:hypothetical protein
VKEVPIYQDSRLEIEETPNLKHQIPNKGKEKFNSCHQNTNDQNSLEF